MTNQQPIVYVDLGVGGMTCDDWKAFLQDHVSGGLSDAARAAVDRHLSDCGGCFGEARLRSADAFASVAEGLGRAAAG